MSVNLPGLALAQASGSHRLILVHRNVPGVLATINAVFAEHKANVEAQLLGTRGEVGYVVTDIASVFTDEMIGAAARAARDDPPAHPELTGPAASSRPPASALPGRPRPSRPAMLASLARLMPAVSCNAQWTVIR